MVFHRKKILAGVLTGLAVSLFVFIFDLTPVQEMFELRTLDWRFRLLSNPARASGDIVIFYIDQKSLDHYANEDGISWPWPRGMYKPVIDFCRMGGVRAIVFDMLYTETSAFGSEDDAEFAAAVEGQGNGFFAFFASGKQAGESERDAIFKDRFSLQVDNAAPLKIPPSQSVTLPVRELLTAARGLGNVSADPDIDGVFRRAPILSSYKGDYYPSLAFAAARYVMGDHPVERRRDGLAVGGRVIPVDRAGRMMIRYHGPRGTYQAYSIGDIIQSAVRIESQMRPSFDPAIVRGKVVIVGCSAPGLMDLRVNPFSSVYPGAEVHATVIDNIMKGDFLTRVPKRLVYFSAVCLAALTGVIMYSVGSVFLLPLLLALLIGAFLAADAYVFMRGIWLETVIPLVTILVTYAVSNTVNYAMEGRKKRQLKQMFSQYSSPAVVDELLKHPDKLKLGGERKELSVFFSDIAGFTTISESMAPEALVDLLNEYLNEMSEVILSYHGTVDKYIGDAIMAVWGATVDQPDHAVRACHAALDCRRQLSAFRESLRKRGLPDLNMRIGVSSGPMLVGNMGSKRRFDYTVIGDVVNLGSRLEGANKNYDTHVMINQRTRELAGDTIVVRELDLLRVKGKNKPITVYELIAKQGEAPFETLEKIRLFHGGLEHYRMMRWDDALAAFTAVLKVDPDDGPSKIYVDRVNQFRQSPPSDGWDGVFALKTK